MKIVRKFVWLLLTLGLLVLTVQTASPAALGLAVCMAVLPLLCLPFNLLAAGKLKLTANMPVNLKKGTEGVLELTVQNPSPVPVCLCACRVRLENQLNGEAQTVELACGIWPKRPQTVRTAFGSPFCGRIRLTGRCGNSSGSCGDRGFALLVGGAALFLLFLELLHLRHGALLFHGKAALPRSLTAGRTAVSRLALHIAHGGQEQGGVLVVRRHGSLARDTLAAFFRRRRGTRLFLLREPSFFQSLEGIVLEAVVVCHGSPLLLKKKPRQDRGFFHWIKKTSTAGQAGLRERPQQEPQRRELRKPQGPQEHRQGRQQPRELRWSRQAGPEQQLQARQRAWQARLRWSGVRP